MKTFTLAFAILLSVLTATAASASTSSSTSGSAPKTTCHPFTGVWIQSELVEMFNADPCSITVQTSTGETVMKLDRVRVTCQGAATSAFGFDDERFEGDSFGANQLRMISPNVLIVKGYPGAELSKVEDSAVNKMFQTARACLQRAQ